MPGLLMRDVNLNWQQILHKDISEHQAAPAFDTGFSFPVIKTLQRSFPVQPLLQVLLQRSSMLVENALSKG